MSKMKVLADWVTSEISSWIADSCLLTVRSQDLFVCVYVEKEHELFGVSSYKDPNSIGLGPHPYKLI